MGWDGVTIIGHRSVGANNEVSGMIVYHVFTLTPYTSNCQLSKRARSGRKRERALRPGTRIHLGRGGQSANSMKLYKISSWEPGKKHQSTCRAS